MASKADLRIEAERLAADLKIPINTEGLDHKKLTELVSDLKAKERDGELDTQADGPATTADTPEAEYTVKKGKALTTMRGIVADGEPVCAADFAGGQGTLDDLVRKGFVVAPSA